MPNSKHRKRQVAAQKRQIERAKRLLELKREDEKENASPPNSKVPKYNDDQTQQGATDEASGWLGGLYSWCHTGISQVDNLVYIKAT